MRFKSKVKEALHYLAFAFYPKTTLMACAVFSVIVIAILGIVMALIPQQSAWYNVVFALTTGAAGSFFVSFVVELAGNFRHNKLAWYELHDYYSAVEKYELHKQVMMQLMPHQRAEKQAHDEFVAAGGIEEVDDDDKPKDIIQITWELLPELIPVFNRTIDEKKEFLNNEEIEVLNSILCEYEQIKFSVRERILMSSMTYDALNHPDEEYLKSIYPADVLGNMPHWALNHLASEESQKACDRFAAAILSDAFLLSQFMENYEISQRGIDYYQSEIDKLEEEEYEPEDVDYDELDFSEPEDEETFKTQKEEFYRQMELEQRPFVSWHISNCCKNISACLDILEDNIIKKPYYGMMIEFHRNAAKESADDPLSKLSYQREKRQLDKRLAKQKQKAND